jgi:PhnB protein
MARSARSKNAARPVSRKTSAARPAARKAATNTRRAKASGRPAKAAKSSQARKASRPKRAQPVPAAYGSLTPHLIVSPAADAVAFYVKAFGAKPGMMMDGPGGLIMHGEVKIGDSILMLADEQPPMGPGPQTNKSPKSLGGTSATLMLYVKDVDAVYARAVEAGATSVMPPSDMFWGDRYSQVVDPFGHLWSIATHLRDLTPAQMKKAAMAAMAEMAAPPPSA